MDRCSVSHAPWVDRWSAPYAVPSNPLPPRSIASRIYAALLSMRTPPPRGGTSLVLPSHQTRDGISGAAPHASHRPGAPADESAPSPADISPDPVSCTTPHSHQALRPKGGARWTRNHPPEQVFSEQRPPRG